MTNARSKVTQRLLSVISSFLVAAGLASATTITSTTTKLTDAQLADEWWPTTVITNVVQLAEGFSRQDGFYMPTIHSGGRFT